MHECAEPVEAQAAPGWSPRLWAVLLVLCGALFLDSLDESMVGVALPEIRSSLGLSTSSLQWLISGYVLGYGGLLLLGGRAADLLGRRRVFLTALAVFAAASWLRRGNRTFRLLAECSRSLARACRHASFPVLITSTAGSAGGVSAAASRYRRWSRV